MLDKLVVIHGNRAKFLDILKTASMLTRTLAKARHFWGTKAQWSCVFCIYGLKSGFWTLLWCLGFFWTYRTAAIGYSRYSSYPSMVMEKKVLNEGKSTEKSRIAFQFFFLKM